VNNLIEQDTRGVKQRIAAMLGFKGLSNAAITIGLSAPAALLLEPSKKIACKLRHSFENTGSHMTPRWREPDSNHRSWANSAGMWARRWRRGGLLSAMTIAPPRRRALR
jgi:hypothetical protein